MTLNSTRILFLCLFSFLGMLNATADCDAGSVSAIITLNGYHYDIPLNVVQTVNGEASCNGMTVTHSAQVGLSSTEQGYVFCSVSATVNLNIGGTYTLTGHGSSGWADATLTIPAGNCYTVTVNNADGSAGNPLLIRIAQGNESIIVSVQPINATGILQFSGGEANVTTPGVSIAAGEDVDDGPSFITVTAGGTIDCWNYEGDSLGCKPPRKINATNALIQVGERSGILHVLGKTSAGCGYRGQVAVAGKKQCCSTCDRFGATSTKLNSALIEVFLGLDRYSRDAGFLYVDAYTRPGCMVAGDVPTDPNQSTTELKHRLTQRRAFRVSSEIEYNTAQLPRSYVIYHNNLNTTEGISQVVTPSGLAVIEEVANSLYEIYVKCYKSGDYTLSTTPGGPATIPSASVPIRIVKCEHPLVGSVRDMTRLVVTDTLNNNPPQITVSRYEHVSAQCSQVETEWKLSRDGVAEWEQLTEEGTTAAFIRTRSTSSLNSSGATVITRQSQETYASVNGQYKKTLEWVGSTDNYETRVYHNAPGTSKDGKLKCVRHFDGSADYFPEYDTAGRLTKRMKAAFALGSLNNGPSTSASRYETYDYTSMDPLDNDANLEPNLPRTIIRSENNQQLGMEFNVVHGISTSSGLFQLTIDNYKTISPVATIGDINNLKHSKTYRYIPLLKTPPMIDSEIKPDGTIVRYTYAHAYRTDVVDENGDFKQNYIPNPNVFELNPSGTYWIWENSTMVRIVEEGHMNGATFVLHRITKQVTGLIGESIYNDATDFTPTGGLALADQKQNRLFREYFSYAPTDTLRRYPTVKRLDGRTSVQGLGCCGTEFSVNYEGTQEDVTYDYDRNVVQTVTSDGNPTSPSSKYISYVMTYDRSGNLLKRSRVGADNSVIDAIKMGYDTAGRVISLTNALAGINSITYSYISEVSGGMHVKIDESSISDGGGTRSAEYYSDGRVYRITGDKVRSAQYEYGVATRDFGTAEGVQPRSYVRETALTRQLDGNGAFIAWVPTSEVKVTYFDALNRPRLVERGTTVIGADKRWFNKRGQITKAADADGVIRLWNYNARGELELEAIDGNPGDTTLSTDGNYTPSIDLANDKVTKYLRQLIGVGVSGTTYPAVQTEVYARDSSQGWVKARDEIVGTDGIRSWSTVYKDTSQAGSSPVTWSYREVFDGLGYRREMLTAPDGSTNVSQYLHGQINATYRTMPDGTFISGVGYRRDIDPHRRVKEVSVHGGIISVQSFNNADQPTSVLMPAANAGEAQQIYQYLYDTAGRIRTTILPDTSTVERRYYPNGLLKLEWGKNAVPSGYKYDDQWRVAELLTWKSFTPPAGSSDAFPGGFASTRWIYDVNRGWLDKKEYPVVGGIIERTQYKYSLAGRLTERWWQRDRPGSPGTLQRTVYTTHLNAKANFGIDSAVWPGDLEGITYDSDGLTPPVGYGYDQRGRLTKVLQTKPDGIADLVTSLSYNNADELLTESFNGPIVGGISTTRGYDGLLRRNSLNVNPGISPWTVGYGYDGASRLARVDDGSLGASYQYEPGTDSLIRTTAFGPPMAGSLDVTPRLTTARTFDSLNRLKTQATKLVGGMADAFGLTYKYNSLNLRNETDLSDGSKWIYGYDDIGQLTTGKHFWPDQTPVAGQAFEYTFDKIGNRTSAKNGGNNAGQNLRVFDYSNPVANDRNEYVQRTVPRTFDVVGTAAANLTVQIGTASIERHGDYFHGELAAGGAASEWKSVTVNVQGITVKQGNVFVPPATETFTYDSDGNLTADGRWNYTWDAENRLVAVESRTDTPLVSHRRIQYTYDYASRIIQRDELAKNGSGVYTLSIRSRYAYDGWQCVYEEQTQGGTTLKQKYLWGADLSGTRGGAGGIGGLVAISDLSSNLGSHYYVYDGNGNVMGLANAAGTMMTARYEYGPFGESLRLSELASSAGIGSRNGYRFSTKRTDSTTDQVLYEYRVYNPSIGRWPNRDPLGESGGINLYGFVGNNPFNAVDPMGLYILDDDGFPINGSYNGLGAYLYDRETKDEHDRIMHNAAEKAKELGKAACMFFPYGRLGKAAGPALRFLYNSRKFKSIANAAETTALRNPNVYEALVEAPISGTSRAAHRASANEFLANQLRNDAQLNGMFNQQLGGNVLQHMESGSSLLNPAGTVWHHPFDNPNVMQLLRTGEHTAPSLRPVLHPGGVGGFGNFYGP